VQEMEVQLQVNEVGEPQQTGREVWENRIEAEIAIKSKLSPGQTRPNFTNTTKILSNPS
jgi:hypothetical protein